MVLYLAPLAEVLFYWRLYRATACPKRCLHGEARRKSHGTHASESISMIVYQWEEIRRHMLYDIHDRVPHTFRVLTNAPISVS